MHGGFFLETGGFNELGTWREVSYPILSSGCQLGRTEPENTETPSSSFWGWDCPVWPLLIWSYTIRKKALFQLWHIVYLAIHGFNKYSFLLHPAAVQCATELSCEGYWWAVGLRVKSHSNQASSWLPRPDNHCHCNTKGTACFLFVAGTDFSPNINKLVIVCRFTHWLDTLWCFMKSNLQQHPAGKWWWDRTGQTGVSLYESLSVSWGLDGGGYYPKNHDRNSITGFCPVKFHSSHKDPPVSASLSTPSSLLSLSLYSDAPLGRMS